MPRLVFVSDTHGLMDRMAIPDGDILVHAGDGTGSGRLPELVAWNAQMQRLPHAHKVFIAGNHDFAFERTPEAARAVMTAGHYLQDSGVTLMGLRFWGSPWQPWFHDWAFNLARGEPLARQWALIPPSVDVLITHGPPLGVGDRCFDGRHVGCADLRDAVLRLQPRVHVFGHIHEAYGEAVLGTTRCINASSCNEDYQPVQPPVVVDLPAAE